jgi:hypothetical protein
MEYSTVQYSTVQFSTYTVGGHLARPDFRYLLYSTCTYWNGVLYSVQYTCPGSTRATHHSHQALGSTFLAHAGVLLHVVVAHAMLQSRALRSTHCASVSRDHIFMWGGYLVLVRRTASESLVSCEPTHCGTSPHMFYRGFREGIWQ